MRSLVASVLVAVAAAQSCSYVTNVPDPLFGGIPGAYELGACRTIFFAGDTDTYSYDFQCNAAEDDVVYTVYQGSTCSGNVTASTPLGLAAGVDFVCGGDIPNCAYDVEITVEFNCSDPGQTPADGTSVTLPLVLGVCTQNATLQCQASALVAVGYGSSQDCSTQQLPLAVNYLYDDDCPSEDVHINIIDLCDTPYSLPTLPDNPSSPNCNYLASRVVTPASPLDPVRAIAQPVDRCVAIDDENVASVHVECAGASTVSLTAYESADCSGDPFFTVLQSTGQESTNEDGSVERVLVQCGERDCPASQVTVLDVAVCDDPGTASGDGTVLDIVTGICVLDPVAGDSFWTHCHDDDGDGDEDPYVAWARYENEDCSGLSAEVYGVDGCVYWQGDEYLEIDTCADVDPDLGVLAVVLDPQGAGNCENVDLDNVQFGDDNFQLFLFQTDTCGPNEDGPGTVGVGCVDQFLLYSVFSDSDSCATEADASLLLLGCDGDGAFFAVVDCHPGTDLPATNQYNGTMPGTTNYFADQTVTIDGVAQDNFPVPQAPGHCLAYDDAQGNPFSTFIFCTGPDTATQVVVADNGDCNPYGGNSFQAILIERTDGDSVTEVQEDGTEVVTDYYVYCDGENTEEFAVARLEQGLDDCEGPPEGTILLPLVTGLCLDYNAADGTPMSNELSCDYEDGFTVDVYVGPGCVGTPQANVFDGCPVEGDTSSSITVGVCPDDTQEDCNGVIISDDLPMRLAFDVCMELTGDDGQPLSYGFFCDAYGDVYQVILFTDCASFDPDTAVLGVDYVVADVFGPEDGDFDIVCFGDDTCQPSIVDISACDGSGGVQELAFHTGECVSGGVATCDADADAFVLEQYGDQDCTGPPLVTLFAGGDGCLGDTQFDLQQCNSDYVNPFEPFEGGGDNCNYVAFTAESGDGDDFLVILGANECHEVEGQDGVASQMYQCANSNNARLVQYLDNANCDGELFVASFIEDGQVTEDGQVFFVDCSGTSCDTTEALVSNFEGDCSDDLTDSTGSSVFAVLAGLCVDTSSVASVPFDSARMDCGSANGLQALTFSDDNCGSEIDTVSLDGCLDDDTFIEQGVCQDADGSGGDDGNESGAGPAAVVAALVAAAVAVAWN